MRLTSKLSLASAALLVGVWGQGAQAASISTTNLGSVSGKVTKTGTLTDEAQVIEEAFMLSAVSDLTVFTTSYGGGTNLNGTTTPPGGFQPMVTLYDSAGNYVMGEEVTSPIADRDPRTDVALDAYLKSTSLKAGGYIVTLTDIFNQQPVTATNLSDGFTGVGGPAFADVQGNTRNGNFALNLSVTPASSAVPEPASFWLVLLPLAGIALLIRKCRAAES